MTCHRLTKFSVRWVEKSKKNNSCMGQDNSSNLCTNCGACCDGTVFDHAFLEATDLNHETSQWSTTQIKGKLGFKFPCSALVNSTCTIYDHRPAICGNYECKVLKQYKKGEVDENEAFESINKLKSAKQEIDLLLTKAGIDDKAGGIRGRMRVLEQTELLKMTSAEYRKTHGILLIKYRLFQEILSDKFGVSFKLKK